MTQSLDKTFLDMTTLPTVIAGDAYPVEAPGLAPSGVHAIQT